MARRPRSDSPGSWHHVINRGIAKRPYFEARSDRRYFLARLASEVRAGRIEVHAFSLMTTHFHLLVRSPIGELSEAMRRVQCAYSRYFNRRRRRDGPLIRARFFSKRVESDSYRRAVIRYIDANAVRAGVVRAAAEHQHGSARAYVHGPAPIWLSTEWVRSETLTITNTKRFSAVAYLKTFAPPGYEGREALAGLVEARMASTAEIDPIDDLIGRTPRQVRSWMTRKARLADGMPLGLPLCAAPVVLRAVERFIEARGEWHVAHDDRFWSASLLLRAGLLRELCSLPMRRVASLSDTSRWCAAQHVSVHRALLAKGQDYATSVGEIAREALHVAIPA